MFVNNAKRTPPINPGTGETAWVYWGGGCDLPRGQIAVMMIVERVTMDPAHPSGRAPACSRDDSQQETGNPEHTSARPEGAKMQENNAARSRKAEKETQKEKHRENARPPKNPQNTTKQPLGQERAENHTATRPKKNLPKKPGRTLR